MTTSHGRVAVCLLLSSHWIGCSQDADHEAPPAPSAADALLAAPPPGQGVQYAMTTAIEPGAEVEHCRFVQAPPAGLLVNHDAVRFTAGSHHVLLYETPYDGIPTVTRDGTPVDTRDVFDCSAGATNDWDVTKLIAGSQNGQGQSMLEFPEGIALRVRPSTVLLINAHYINTGDEPIQPELRINLYTVAERDLRAEGDLLFFYNPFIRAEVGERSRARMRCPIDHDITLTNAQSHMHARGAGYAAMIEGSEAFYTGDRWQDVPVRSFDEGLQVRAGQRLDYYCEYENTGDSDVYQGLRTSDEMCMLIGSYYPAYPALSTCDREEGGMASEWVGNGQASCAETLACMRTASAAGARDMRRLTDCIVESDPRQAGPMSALVRCRLAADDPDRDCAPEIAACTAR
jgi:hypothetical protein